MKPTSSSPSNISSRTDDIQLLAYELWVQAGYPAGKDLHFWLEAEKQVDSSSQQASQANAPKETLR